MISYKDKEMGSTFDYGYKIVFGRILFDGGLRGFYLLYKTNKYEEKNCYTKDFEPIVKPCTQYKLFSLIWKSGRIHLKSMDYWK